jgi:DNA (cytosine-5)-methyltransferase 1
MLKAISLFSGAGGLDIGFKRVGFDVRLAVEIDPSCCDTLKRNMPETTVVNADVTEFSGQELCTMAGLALGDVDCLFGGPPCQSFSLAGNRRGFTDPRGQMIAHFVRLVHEIGPRTFVMENVKGMVNWDDGAALKYIQEAFLEPINHKLGKLQYKVSYQVLNAVDFGAAQRRERIFVVGNRLDRIIRFPKPTHGNIENLKKSVGLKPFNTVGKELEKLPKPDLPSETAIRVSGTIKERRVRHGY